MNVDLINPFMFNSETEPQGITLTKEAESHIRNQLNIRNKGIGIRFGVTGAGCGGYSYIVEFVDTDGGEDYIFKQDDIKIFIDKKSIILIDGMQVDYITDGFSSGLAFNNPLAGQTCGCGESFTVN